jgi:26S proteasome regulatory subunit N3
MSSQKPADAQPTASPAAGATSSSSKEAKKPAEVPLTQQQQTIRRQTHTQHTGVDGRHVQKRVCSGGMHLALSSSGGRVRSACEYLPESSPDLALPRVLPAGLRSHVFMIRKGVVQHDARLLTRVLREITAIRGKLTAPVMKAFTEQYAPTLTQSIVDAQGAIMSDETQASEDLSAPVHAAAAAPAPAPTPAVAGETPTAEQTAAAALREKRAAEAAENQRKEKELLAAVVPEVDIYIQLLTAYFLYDKGLKDEAATVAQTLFLAVNNFNRRTLDTLSAKVFTFYSLVNESLGKDVEVRNSLLLAHRTACLQHNEPGQAALSVCILRNYLNYHLYTQADTFRLKSNFPDQRSNAQTARYCYYIGKIQAVQLHYSDAFASLTQALRKAPQKAAVGFRQSATKLLILVQLLMGDIPERSLFSPKELQKSLAPYLALTQAVRVGDLAQFNAAMTKHKVVFERDGIYSLIVRLRSNVIKAGLRKINLAYSKISIQDICAKLKLDSVDDGEYMVAKAIHDGVIDATVDRAAREVFSKEVVDVYATNEPQQAYHKRIQFTMEIHHQAVKSLRYPQTAGAKKGYDLESDDEEDEDTIAGNAPDKREEEKKKDA